MDQYKLRTEKNIVQTHNASMCHHYQTVNHFLCSLLLFICLASHPCHCQEPAVKTRHHQKNSPVILLERQLTKCHSKIKWCHQNSCGMTTALWGNLENFVHVYGQWDWMGWSFQGAFSPRCHLCMLNAKGTSYLTAIRE